ncbi:MAG: glycosyltransferase [Rikenellaceae bacterium]
MKKLTLIIATFNRSEWVIETLQSVIEQSAEAAAWECIVVNNNSSDDTVERVEEFISEHNSFDIKIVTETKQGLSHARNRGIEESIGEYIAIIDDDEIINTQFIEAYIEFFDSHPSVASAGGKIIARYRSSRPKWMSKYTERPIANPIDLGDVVCEFPRGVIPGGGNMAIQRWVLDKYGAFDPSLGRCAEKLIGGEESDLFERLRVAGEECWFVPEAVMYHLIPDEKLNHDYLNRLSYNIGVSQRLRAKIEKRGYRCAEIIKWLGTIAIALGYTLKGQTSKANYLIQMRYHISRGIFS